MAEHIERGANCVDCIHAEVCLSQYGSQVKRWALTDGCKRFKSKADVVEVVHGEWILHHVGAGHYWECSACRKNACIYVTQETKYCPNCGAKMDGKDGEGK